MSVSYYDDYPEDHAEIRIPFNTFDSNDPSASVTVTDLVDADIEVHADGDVTPIATDGASVIINFAGETGSHMILIDSSVDAAYTTGTEYAVKVVGVTIDGATVNAWVGAFSIERAGGVLALLKGGTDGLAAHTTLLLDIPTVAEFNARTLVSASYFDPAADAVANVTLVATVTTVTNQLTAAVLADAVWDEDIVAAHATADTAGLIISQLTKRSVTWATAVASGSMLDQMADDGTAAFDRTTDSLQAIADGGGGLTAAAVADAVWDELQVDHVIVDSFGILASEIATLQTTTDGIPTTAEFEARTLVSASYFDPAADAVANVTLVATTTTNTDMVAAAPTAAANADAVWDELQAAHVIADSFGILASEIATLQTTADGIPTTAEFDARTLVAASYFDPAADTVAIVTTLTGHTAQTADHTASIAAIKAKTDSLTFTVANVLDANALRINSAVVVGDGNATPWDGA